MWRIGRIGKRMRKAGLWSGGATAALIVGFLLLMTPIATAASGEREPYGPAGVVVLAQSAPPSGQQPAPPAGPSQPAPAVSQRTVVGAAGVVLIVLVLLSRKLRNKPVFGTWRPKK